MITATASLWQFHWRGVDRQGQHHHGRYLAQHESEVASYLQQQGIQLLTLEAHAASLLTRWKESATPQDIALMTRQIATLLDSGIPLGQALQLIRLRHRKAQMRSLISTIQTDIGQGYTLADSLEKYPLHFDPVYISLIRSAEQHGQLSAMFERICHYQQQRDQFKKKIVRASLYPMLVVVVSIIVTYIMLVMVIPQFSELFNSFQASLPWLTQQVMSLSHSVQKYSWLLIILTLLSGSIATYSYVHSPLIKKRVSYWILRLPILGKLYSRAAFARFCYTCATSLKAGVPIMTTFTISTHSIGNCYLASLIPTITQRIADGESIHQAIAMQPEFPETMKQLIMVGEETGCLDEMFSRIAVIYEQEVKNQLDTIEKLVEPTMILFLGLMIGGLVLAMYLPVFNLAGVLS